MTTNQQMEQQDNPTGGEYPWGVCTVCLPRESYHWLRDWMEHHIKAGASKIVIYDNTGSTGSTRRSSVFCTGRYQRNQVSKRGEPYGKLTSHLSDEELKRELHGIVAEFPEGRIDIVDWQPRDPGTGQIVHGQVEAYADFIRNHRTTLAWAAFIDMDEYLYCRPGLTVDTIIRQLEREHEAISLLQLRAWRFECRWSQDGPKSIETFTRHKAVQWGGEKNFARLRDITHANIHWDWTIAKGTVRAMADAMDFGFCHYNQKPSDLEEAVELVRPRDFLVTPADPGLTLNLLRPLMPSGSELVPPMPINIEA